MILLQAGLGNATGVLLIFYAIWLVINLVVSIVALRFYRSRHRSPLGFGKKLLCVIAVLTNAWLIYSLYKQFINPY